MAAQSKIQGRSNLRCCNTGTRAVSMRSRDGGPTQRFTARRGGFGEDRGTLRVAGPRHAPVERRHLDAADTAAKVGRHTDCAPDDGHVERENDDERNGGVSGELDVVKRHVHEPVVDRALGLDINAPSCGRRTRLEV